MIFYFVAGVILLAMFAVYWSDGRTTAEYQRRKDLELVAKIQAQEQALADLRVEIKRNFEIEAVHTRKLIEPVYESVNALKSRQADIDHTVAEQNLKLRHGLRLNITQEKPFQFNILYKQSAQRPLPKKPTNTEIKSAIAAKIAKARRQMMPFDN